MLLRCRSGRLPSDTDEGTKSSACHPLDEAQASATAWNLRQDGLLTVATARRQCAGGKLVQLSDAQERQTKNSEKGVGRG